MYLTEYSIHMNTDKPPKPISNSEIANGKYPPQKLRKDIRIVLKKTWSLWK